MLMTVVRVLFAIAMFGVGLLLSHTLFEKGALAAEEPPEETWWPMLVPMLFGIGSLLIIAFDLSIRRKDISLISAVFFGLVVGLIVTILLGPVVEITAWLKTPEQQHAAKVAIAVITSYLAVSFILQTKDDFRFIIPYIEFAKQEKGGRALLLDTSVIIDGRIADIVDTGTLDAPLVVPRFVLMELQGVADSSDKLRRQRGRRGLDILNRLQTTPDVDISIQEPPPGVTTEQGVDEALVAFAAETGGRVMTNDYNLNKVAKLSGVEVININDLANALKPAVLPGEPLDIKVLREGQEAGQGVGYLEDGTMVVVEDGREHIGEEVTIVVTSTLQTSAGRLIFGRVDLTEKQA